MTRLLVPAGISLLVALAAAPAAAQSTGCVVADIAENGYARNLAGPGGTSILFVSGWVEIHCGTDVVVRADSAHNTGRELRLIGNVFYQDSTQTMTSETATYERDIGRVTARGDVVVRDRAGPSVVRGSELQYDREMPNRPEVRIIVRGRPRAFLYEEGTPPLPAGMEPSPGLRIVAGDTIPAALQVDADRLELQGENRILAHGRVQMIREGIRAFSDAADYDRAAGRMELTANARIEGEGYELFGERIVANLAEEQLEHVVSEGNAQLLGEAIDVRAPLIDIALEAGEVERMIAVSHQAGVQASAVAEDFTLSADSIQGDAPAGVIERLTAIGTAYGTRAADSLSADLPEIIRTDWLRGDTIVGTFIRVEGALAAADSAAAAGDTARTELETLTATGNARSLYRMDSSDDETDEQAVNYLVATRIGLRFVAGEVSSVETAGPVEGVHLEPIREARAGDAEAATDGAVPAATDADTSGPGASR